MGGVFPENGTTLSIVLVLAAISLSITFGICAMVLTSSMIADVTDASEAKTGRRTEGIYFAGFFFMQKCVGGLGILVSSLILSFTGFPEGAQPGAVNEDVLDRLAVTFAIITVIIGIACAYMFSRFPLSRADHEARLAEIANR